MSSRDDQLLLAIRKGLPEVRLALEQGANPNGRDVEESPALHLAVAASGAGMVRMLLKAGADPSARDQWRRTALHKTISRRNEEAFDALMAAGADREAEDIYGTRPLHEAAKMGRLWALKALLEAGVDERAQDKEGRDAMVFMRASGFLEGIRELQAALARKEREALGRIAGKAASKKEGPRL